MVRILPVICYSCDSFFVWVVITRARNRAGVRAKASPSPFSTNYSGFTRFISSDYSDSKNSVFHLVVNVSSLNFFFSWLFFFTNALVEYVTLYRKIKLLVANIIIDYEYFNRLFSKTFVLVTGKIRSSGAK